MRCIFNFARAIKACTIGIVAISVFINISFVEKAVAATLELKNYQLPSGAITLFAHGTSIDPYFATKALLAAHELGLDIDIPAQKWIVWLLPRQQPDGLFNRYCRLDETWKACGAADADDSMAAVWIQLLSLLSNRQKMPHAWEQSVQQSLRVLRKLRNGKNLYEIASNNPVTLLMDNCEVYAGLNEYAVYLRSIQQDKEFDLIHRQMTQLNKAIVKEFWHPDVRAYQITSQKIVEETFYPTHVAQLYPFLHGLPGLHSGAEIWTFNYWAKFYGEEWLNFSRDHFPWGLIAVAAYKENALDWARMWVARSEKLRNTPRWNLLEEAVFEGLSAKFK